VLLTLRTQVDDRPLPEGHPAKAAQEGHTALTEETQRWFRYARFKMQTVDDVMEGLESRSGVQHVIQAGIDRVNQNTTTASQMINNWRVLPKQFTYASGEVSLSGELKRSAIKDRHGLCIANMFVDQSEERHTNSQCEVQSLKKSSANTIISQQLSQIKEEDETKTSSRNSMTPSAARRHGTVDLDGEKQRQPASKSQQEASDDTMDLVVEASKKLSVAAAAAGHNSDTEDDDDDDGIDPDVKERERKSSEQRIIAIVHSTPPPQDSSGGDGAAFEPGEEEFLDSLVAAAMSADYGVGDKADSAQIQNAIAQPSGENQMR